MENIVNQSQKDEPESGITHLLNDILESSTFESLPSTSKSDSFPRLPNNVPQTEAVPVHSNENLNSKLKEEKQFPRDPADSDAETDNNDQTHENIPFGTCTVKEILNEILDCTVVRRPSMLLPTTSTATSSSQGNFAEPNLEPLTEFILDPKLIPRHLFGIRTGSDESARSRMQYTVKEALNEILDYTIFKKSIHSRSYRTVSSNDRPGTSYARPPGELEANQREYQVYRAMGANLIRSASAPQGETFIQRPSLKSLGRILPSYSTVMKLGPPPTVKSFHSSGSFMPRQPPPSYAEVEGLWEDNPSLISSESAVFGPDPAYMVCPTCRAVVVTEVQSQRSNMAHLVALVMCLLMCWPCCLLPYCLRSCNYSYHSCPNCGHYFGMYRPF